MRPANQCGPCGEDFITTAAFDAHRVGTHDYTYSEGACMEPMREDGRRCLSIREMQARGWQRDAKGRWSTARAARRDLARAEL